MNHKEALIIYEKGIELNPTSIVINENRRSLLLTIDPDKAIKLLIENKEYNRLSTTYWNMGRKQEAITVAEQEDFAGLLQFYKEGRNDLMVEEVTNFHQTLINKGVYVSTYLLGTRYAYAGQLDKALEYFNIALQIQEPNLTLLLLTFTNRFLIPHDNPDLLAIKRKVREMIIY